MKHRIPSSWRRQFRLVALAATASIFVLPLAASQAAVPSSGTIGPNDTTPLAWDGPVTGGASADESTCVEGVNCDTFTLTVSGTAADWAGKLVAVRISWTIPANDYDLYIHQGSNSGPTVGSSAGGAPDTDE